MKSKLYYLLSFVLVMPLCLTSCALVNRVYENTNVDNTVVDSEKHAPGQELSLRVLHKADYNIDDRPTIKGFTVLADAASYKSELKKYSVEFPAEIDFQSFSVVAATMGTQAKGGYAIGAVKAEEFEDKVVVEVELVSPADNCLTTQAQSNPYEFFAVPSRKMIEFAEVTRVAGCE